MYEFSPRMYTFYIESYAVQLCLSGVCTTQVYVHNVSCASRKVRVLRPFVALSFVMMSLLCCLARYGLRYNHWTDVVVGFVVGVLLAVYIVSRLHLYTKLTVLRVVYLP